MSEIQEFDYKFRKSVEIKKLSFQVPTSVELEFGANKILSTPLMSDPEQDDIPATNWWTGNYGNDFTSTSTGDTPSD